MPSDHAKKAVDDLVNVFREMTGKQDVKCYETAHMLLRERSTFFDNKRMIMDYHITESVTVSIWMWCQRTGGLSSRTINPLRKD